MTDNSPRSGVRFGRQERADDTAGDAYKERDWRHHRIALIMTPLSLFAIALVYYLMTNIISRSDVIFIDNSHISVSRFVHELQTVELKWKILSTRLSLDTAEESATLGEQEGFEDLQIAQDVLRNRVTVIREGDLYGYTARHPELQPRIDRIVTYKLSLEELLNSEAVYTAALETEVNKVFETFRRELSVFAAIVQRIRADRLTANIDRFETLKRLLGVAILVTIASFGYYLYIVLRQNMALLASERLIRQQIEVALKAKKDAEVSLEARTSLFANTSHELRTPLNAILGFSQMIEGQMLGPVGQPKYVNYAKSIRTSGEVLLDLVDDLLVLGEVGQEESGGTPLNLDWINVDALLDDACDMVKEKYQRRNLDIQRFGITGLSIESEEKSVRQIVVNLLDNAAKYGRHEAPIRVSVVMMKDHVEILIEDEGKGIPESMLKIVLDPFARGMEPFVRQTEGAGLGLAIVDSLVQRLSGRMIFENRLVGGLRAGLRFPSEMAIDISECGAAQRQRVSA